MLQAITYRKSHGDKHLEQCWRESNIYVNSSIQASVTGWETVRLRFTAHCLPSRPSFPTDCCGFVDGTRWGCNTSRFSLWCWTWCTPRFTLQWGACARVMVLPELWRSHLLCIEHFHVFQLWYWSESSLNMVFTCARLWNDQKWLAMWVSAQNRSCPDHAWHIVGLRGLTHDHVAPVVYVQVRSAISKSQNWASEIRHTSVR